MNSDTTATQAACTFRSAAAPLSADELQHLSAEDFVRYLQRLLATTAYSPTVVSWEDGWRTPGSCWGPNISDVVLTAKSGERLCMIRRNNYDDTVSIVSASDIGLGADVTLASFLRNIGDRCSRLGMQAGTNLYAPQVDATRCSVRFTHTFLPPHVREFCSTVHNYQTVDATDPKNTIIVAAKTGISVCQDTPGKQMLLINGDARRDGTCPQSWFNAAPRGKDSSTLGASVDESFGLPFMDRMDAQSCIITVQVPHAQAQRASRFASPQPSDAPVYRSLSAPGASAVTLEVGSFAREGAPIQLCAPKRDQQQPMTVTFSFYEHGVPTADDVTRIVRKLDALYAACVSGSRHTPVIASALTPLAS